LEAELPGVKKEDLEINIKDDYLVIKGEKKSFNEEKKKGQLIKVERSFGSFYRTIALPSDIDKEQVNAELKDGLLHIEIKKSANQVSEQKKIPVH
jgi:HSP20 family protein